MIARINPVESRLQGVLLFEQLGRVGGVRREAGLKPSPGPGQEAPPGPVREAEWVGSSLREAGLHLSGVHRAPVVHHHPKRPGSEQQDGRQSIKKPERQGPRLAG